MSNLSDITFKDFANNCEVLKEQYSNLLIPFFDVNAIRCWKKMVYSLDLPEWKRDLIWECLNNDISVDELKHIAEFTN